jgi:translation initiation factor IF-2
MLMSGKLAPEHRETILGVAQVREVFRSSKSGAAAGCMVMEGVIHRNKPIRVFVMTWWYSKVNLNRYVVIKM